MGTVAKMCSTKDMNLNEDVRMLSLNIRSIRKHFNDLIIFLNSAQCKYHLIILSETWIYTEEVNRYYIPGYVCIAQCRDDKRSGGVMIYTQENLCYSDLKLTLETGNIVGLNFTLENHKIFTLIGIYRFCESSFPNYIAELNSILTSTEGLAVITGDININLLDNHSSNDYLNMMYSQGFSSIVDEPTFFGREGSLPSCIDHIFMRGSIKTGANCSISYDTVRVNFSDHLGLISTLTLHSKLQSQSKSETYIFDKKLFSNCLNAIDISNLYISTASIDDKFYWFISQIKRCLENSKKTVNINNKYRRRSPWVTPQIMRLSREKDLIYKLTILFPSNMEIKLKYKTLSKTIQKAVKFAKKEYYSNLLDRCCKNQKNYWAVINRTIGKQNPVMKELVVGDRNVPVLGNEIFISNYFNEYFRDSVARLVDELSLDSRDFSCSSNTVKSFAFLEFTQEVVMNAISSLTNKSSFGSDGISAPLVKENVQFFKGPLTYLFNESIKCGKFPDILKTGIITPVFKSGLKSECSNYRPICILPTISKIFEKCVVKLILAYLDQVKFFSVNQFGFLKDRGTDGALYEHIKYITETLEAGRLAAAVYFDIRKAFDTVDHSILLKKLYACGIRGFMYNWFKSYLSDRKYMTKINGVVSDAIISQHGVPQGSILGPYLFLIYINDLCNLNVNGRIYSYADDTVLVIDSRYTHILQSLVQNDVNKIMQWLNDNRLVLNTEKTKYMIYTLQQLYGDDKIFSISIGNRILKRVHEIKYLGIFMDTKLTWHKQTLYLARKLRKLNYLFYYLSQIFSIKHLHRLYFALYQPVLSYSIVIWGGAAKAYINPLQVMQNSILRCIFHNKKPQDIKPLPTVKQLYEIQLLNFVFKNRFRFSISKRISKTRTDSEEFACLPRYNKYHTRIQCRYMGAKLFNSLPPQMKVDLRNYKRRHKSLTNFVMNRDLKS